ncbi:MAG: VanZ family protein [Bacilli bacterium]|nr:VanZ family protein [Bacilli bacterium]MBO7536393.1 VanZ family protein [Bacilli bacterium]
MDKKKIIYLIMAIIWVGFIFGNSLLNGATSGSLSGGITEKIYNLLVNMHINIRIETLHTIIRKLAHFSEYFLLGIIIFLNVYQYLKEPKYFISFSIVICLLISIIDETIQTFVDGRSGSIMDVGIDSLGFLLSILILALIIININKKKEQTIS